MNMKIYGLCDGTHLMERTGTGHLQLYYSREDAAYNLRDVQRSANTFSSTKIKLRVQEFTLTPCKAKKSSPPRDGAE